MEGLGMHSFGADVYALGMVCIQAAKIYGYICSFISSIADNFGAPGVYLHMSRAAPTT